MSDNNQQYHQALLNDRYIKDIESKIDYFKGQIEVRKQELKEIFEQ